MPVSTKQATPGPSTDLSTTMNAHIHSVNAKKRSGSEVADDTRDTKKVKVDDKVLPFRLNGKDKDKKKKKKKKKTRRTTVVLGDPERASLKPRSTTVSSTTQKAPSDGYCASGATNNGDTEGREESEPRLSSSDKGKGKAKSQSPSRAFSPPVQAPQPVASTSTSEQASEISRLKEQLLSQATLLRRHEAHLTGYQQSLTCQICLDLMHKPYALAPCGHITCYGCLVRWFTSSQNADNNLNQAGGPGDGIDLILSSATAMNGTYLRRRKNCPVCRANVLDRPVEMWDLKSMVAALVRSELVDLPAPIEQPPPIAPAEEGANNADNDPWRYVFRPIRPVHRHVGEMGPGLQFFMPQVEEDRDDMGWHDAEDGGIYRCIECHNEILAGVCTNCARRYPGHPHGHDDDDSDEEDGWGRDFHIQQYMDALLDDDEDDEEDMDEDDRDLHEEALWHIRQAYQQEEDHEDGDPHDLGVDRIFRAPHVHAVFTDEEDEEEEGDDVDPAYLPDLLERRLHRLLGEHHQHHVQPGIARPHNLFDDEEEEEDSQYEGSFIDDEAGQHQNGSVTDEPVDVGDGDVEENSDDEVEIVDERPRPISGRRVGRIVTSEDEEGEDEEEDPRNVASQLGRGSRVGLQQRLLRAASQTLSFEADRFSEEDHEEDDELHFHRRSFPRRGASSIMSEDGLGDEDEEDDY